MGKKSGGGGTPSPSEYMPLIEQQARLNRVNQYNPLYQTTYRQVPGDITGIGQATTGQAAAPAAPAWTTPTGSNEQQIMQHYGLQKDYTGGGNYRYVRQNVGGEGISWDPVSLGELKYMGLAAPGPEFTPTTPEATPQGQWEQVTQLSPEGQQLFQQQMAAALNPDQYNQTVSNATFQHAMNLLNPQYQQQQRQFEQQMANRGLVSGGEAYNTGYQNMMQAQNQARENAALASVLQGQNAAQQAYSRLAGLTGMGLSGGGNAPGIDVMTPYNMAQQANQAEAASNAAQKQSNTQAAGTAAAAMMYMSDENIKKDKEAIDCNQILENLGDIRIERWKYIGDNREHIGPYAQEFQKAFGVGTGVDINMIDAIGVLMASNQALLERIKALEAQHG